jgi:hypothetical protein
MFVDQTIPKQVDGVTVNYHVMLVAQKSGGKDVNGTYKGAAFVGINFDASQMSNSVLNAIGGFNVNMATYDLSFDLVGYDVEKYSDFGVQGDLPALAPLVKYQAMALISPQMTGTGTLDASITGIQGEHGETGNNTSEGSAAIPMKIAIDGATVLLDVPSFHLTHHFEGTITGTPTGSASPGSTIAQASDHIKSLMDQAKTDAAAAPSGMPDLGGLLNQFKPN